MKMDFNLDEMVGLKDMESSNTAICGLVEALDKVSGIKSVVINEDSECDFEF